MGKCGSFTVKGEQELPWPVGPRPGPWGWGGHLYGENGIQALPQQWDLKLLGGRAFCVGSGIYLSWALEEASDSKDLWKPAGVALWQGTLFLRSVGS